MLLTPTTYILCHAITTAQLGLVLGGVRRAAQAGRGAAAGVRNETHLLVKRLNRISTMTHSHRSFGGQLPSKKSLRSSSGLLLILKQISHTNSPHFTSFAFFKRLDRISTMTHSHRSSVEATSLKKVVYFLVALKRISHI